MDKIFKNARKRTEVVWRDTDEKSCLLRFDGTPMRFVRDGQRVKRITDTRHKDGWVSDAHYKALVRIANQAMDPVEREVLKAYEQGTITDQMIEHLADNLCREADVVGLVLTGKWIEENVRRFLRQQSEHTATEVLKNALVEEMTWRGSRLHRPDEHAYVPHKAPTHRSRFRVGKQTVGQRGFRF